MNDPKVSYAQNGEDIVLWRALGHIEEGCYVDIGANDPVVDSISKLFYDQGWSGVTVEPVAVYADRHREQRPRDTVIQAAVSDSDDEQIALNVIDESGLSTVVDGISQRHREQGWAPHQEMVPVISLTEIVDQHLDGRDVHFCCIDVEGAEAQVLRSVDLTTFRPWVLVVESTAPNSTRQLHQAWEQQVLDAGYEFCLFDGISRFYVAKEHANLKDKLSYPACALDKYSSIHQVNTHAEALRAQADAEQAHAEVELARGAGEEQAAQLRAQLEETREDLAYWRGEVVKNWARLAEVGRHTQVTVDDGAAQRELDAIRNTVSWRVTAPLRVVRSRMGGRG